MRPHCRRPLVRPRWRVGAADTVLALLLLVTACRREPEWRGNKLLPARVVPPVTFADSAGERRGLVPARGTAAVVFFGYTNCPDVCPTTLSDWVRVKRALGNDTSRVRFVFVTVDPERDTPAMAQRYAVQFDPSFVGLSGSAQQTRAVQDAFGVASEKQASASAAGYLVGHSAQSFLVDDRGRVLVSYGFGAGWDVLSADLKQLLR